MPPSGVRGIHKMKLVKTRIKKIVRAALKEDVGKGDITSNFIISEAVRALGLIFARQSGILAGLDIAATVFETLDDKIEFMPRMKDGDQLEEGVVVATAVGSAQTCLAAERTCLNFLQRLSGIATLTDKFVKAVSETNAKILDTRKTTPGLRYLEKYAVSVGGGHNHRFGLYDMVLIKNNHIQLAGSVTEAVNRVRQKNKKLFIEIEVKNLDELREALNLDVNRIMLDNMNIGQMSEAVNIVQGKVELEASGGVNLDNVAEIAQTGVNYISIGELTHSAPSLNFNMQIKSLVGLEK